MTVQHPRRYLGEVVSRRYMIDRLVGEGSFAWVYRARERSGAVVAVKILHSSQSSAALRFAREIKVLLSLPQNAYVAGYVDHGTTRDGKPLLVLEFVDGITLKQGLERRPKLAADKAVAFVSELCQAFVGLHQLGVAHRDVKPENILLARRGGIKLIDFGLIRDAQGILKLLEEEDQIDSRVFSQNLDQGVLAGTPEYMAPEQFSDSAVKDENDTKTDTSSDVFSLGVILYELLMGKKPFPMNVVPAKDYPRELLRYLRWRVGLGDKDIPPMRGINDPLQSIVLKALRRDPGRRQPDSRRLLEDLIHFRNTGEGVRQTDESHTVIVDSERLAWRAHPIGTADTELKLVVPDDEQDEPQEAATTRAQPSLGRPAPAPIVRGHAAPFFERESALSSVPDPLDATALDDENFEELKTVQQHWRGGMTPRTLPSGSTAEHQDVVPTELVDDEDVWPVENLADPPRLGEPEVPTAPADIPSLGEENLFDGGGDEDEAFDLEEELETSSYDETSEMNLAELPPGATKDPKRRR
jgi:serine/threonine protein kinase